MSESKKEESGHTPDKKGCGCCCGVNKVVAKILLAFLLFACGYIFAKGFCSFSSSKTCPTGVK